jgi:ribonuclease T1
MISKGLVNRFWVALALVGSVWVASPAAAFQAGEASRPTVAASDLPPQGQAVLKLIAAGGPFPYEKDGSVFGNRERVLPPQKRGHYREYTVPTPGLKHRGARRIVCGGQQPRTPEACYYTADHYASFRLIVQGQ